MARKKSEEPEIEQEQTETAKEKEAAKATKVAAEPPAETLFSGENVDILHDITMEITVEIGSTQIKLSELLHLKKGSVIELNQEADEPLVIYANDKPIAKGHVMEANGKYCVRII